MPDLALLRCDDAQSGPFRPRRKSLVEHQVSSGRTDYDVALPD